MSLDDRMRGFLELLGKGLVNNPGELEVNVRDGRRATRFEFTCRDEDRGQLIGKGGATIRAMRTLVDISAKRHRRRFEVEIED